MANLLSALAAALTLSLCVISALPGGQPRMDAMTYNIDTLPARDLRPVVDGPETEADYTPPAQAIHTAAQEEATAEVSAEAPAPEAPAREKTESAASAQPAQPVSSTSVLAVGVTADSVRLRAAASTGSAILAELNRGTAVSILGRQDGWYRVNYDGKTGYMSGDYLTLAAARPAAPAPAPTAPTTPAVPASGTGAEIAALARSLTLVNKFGTKSSLPSGPQKAHRAGKRPMTPKKARMQNTSEMLAKTNTTFFSFQPPISRWWWRGAMRKMRLPWVALK